MRILITNDDGIHAPGLAALERIACQLSDDVTVIAPETDQSGVSHSLSLSEPLRLRHVSESRYAVRGTPTDCVIMGVQHVMRDRRANLVLSGVNRGRNVAEDVTYSGTIAGAMEGTLLSVPSVALSQAHGVGEQGVGPRWNCAESHAPGVIRRLLAHGFGRGVLTNVNFPDCEPDEVRGISAVVQGQRDQKDLMEAVERKDFRGNSYFWLAFLREDPDPIAMTDLWALANRRIAVTPLQLNLTDGEALRRLDDVFEGNE